MYIPGRLGLILFGIVFSSVFVFFLVGEKIPTHIVDRGTTKAFEDTRQIYYFLDGRYQEALAEAEEAPATFASIVTEADLVAAARRPVLIQGYDRRSKDYVDGLLETDLIKIQFTEDSTHAKYGIHEESVNCFVRGVFAFGQIVEEKYPPKEAATP